MSGPHPDRNRRTLLALVGPTASGKTEAGLSVAEALGAEIVTIDSMLVYKGMDVGTAKPSPEQRSRVPHHLVDVADPSVPFSVVRFQRLAEETLRSLAEKGRLPLLVGGTGLYFRAVVDGLSFPAGEPQVRRLLETEGGVIGPRALHARLTSFDPGAAARIEPGNLRRTVRALEVAAITGRRFSTFYRDWETYPAGAVWAAGVELPREILQGRIERRVRAMMPELLEETRRLLDGGFDGFLTSTQAIGYAEAVACLRGDISEDEVQTRTIRRTKALARRQMAWFKRDPRIRWFTGGEEGAAGLVEPMVRHLRSGRRDRSGGDRQSMPAVVH